MSNKLKEYIAQVEKDTSRRSAHIEFSKADTLGRHREERRILSEAQDARWNAETLARAARLPKGMSGIWHRLTGRYSQIKTQNERETLDALRRDREEKDALIFRQLDEKQALERNIKAQREAAQEELLQFREEVAHYMSMDRPDHERRRKHSHRKADDDNGAHPKSPRTRRRRGFEP